MADYKCWDYFSTTFDEIMRMCVPLPKPKNRKNIYMTKEAMNMKNKKKSFQFLEKLYLL